MAKSRQRNLLDIAPLPAAPSLPNIGSLPALSPNRTLTHDEQRTSDEYHKQSLVIDVTTQKTVFGITQISAIHRHTAFKFEDTSGYILDIKGQARGQEHRLYLEEFSKHQLQAYARHMLGAAEVGSTAIGLEMNRPLHPEPEPPKRRSLREILFG